MPDLRQYAQQMQKRGYTKKDIRGFLLSKGYPKKDIDDALKTMFSKKEIIAISMVCIAAIALLFLLFSMATPEVKPKKSNELQKTTNNQEEQARDIQKNNSDIQEIKRPPEKTKHTISNNTSEKKDIKTYEIMDTLQYDEKKAIADCRRHPEKDTCLRQIALKTGDARLCLEINTTVKKDGCLADLALDGQDTLCQKIEDAYLREGCTILTER